MAQHAKPSVTVTGDSNLHKLRCIRARVKAQSKRKDMKPKNSYSNFRNTKNKMLTFA